MNILFVNPTQKLRVGMLNLIKGLAQDKSNKIVIITPQKVENPLKGFSNVKLITYPSFFIPKIRYTIPHFLKQYKLTRKIIKKEEIDIIHSWSYFYPVNIMPLVVAKKEGIPILTTIDTFPGINWSYGGGRFIDICAKIYSLTIGRYILSKMDKIVLLGKYLDKPARQMGIKDYVIIPLSVDFERFNIKPSKKLIKELDISDEKVIITIGRLVPVKGIDRVIEASKRLINEGFNIKTLIVGDGPYESEYKDMAKGYPQITFLGRREDIPELLSISDIFVLASISEGFPNVLLEAMAMDIVILTTQVGATNEISKETKKIKLTNAKNIAKEIMKLFLKKNAEDKVNHLFQKKYAMHRVARRYETIYKNIRFSY